METHWLFYDSFLNLNWSWLSGLSFNQSVCSVPDAARPRRCVWMIERYEWADGSSSHQRTNGSEGVNVALKARKTMKALKVHLAESSSETPDTLSFFWTFHWICWQEQKYRIPQDGLMDGKVLFTNHTFHTVIIRCLNPLLHARPCVVFRIGGAARLPARPARSPRTSSATSLFTPSSRPAVCSPSFRSEGSRCRRTLRLPPAPMSPFPRRRAPRAARAGAAAAAGRDRSTGPSPGGRTPGEASTPTPGTARRRRSSRPAWKPSPHWRSPQRTLTETPTLHCCPPFCLLDLTQEPTAPPPRDTCNLVVLSPLGT